MTRELDESTIHKPEKFAHFVVRVADVDEAGAGATATLSVGEGTITVADITAESDITITGGTPAVRSARARNRQAFPADPRPCSAERRRRRV